MLQKVGNQIVNYRKISFGFGNGSNISWVYAEDIMLSFIFANYRDHVG